MEFYDDWGSGDNVKLAVYYRMCDQLVQAIKASDALMATDAQRFEGIWGNDPSILHPDTEKHILAFDLIYCCSTYNLFKGITFVRPKTKERQIIVERKQKAQELLEKLTEANKKQELLNEGMAFLNNAYDIGTEVRHSKLGTGVIVGRENDGKRLVVTFPDNKTVKYGLLEVALNGILIPARENFSDRIAPYLASLRMEKRIRTEIRQAEKELEPFTDYLD